MQYFLLEHGTWIGENDEVFFRRKRACTDLIWWAQNEGKEAVVQ